LIYLIFKKTSLDGAYLIELEKKIDERGFFARVFDVAELKKHSLDSTIVQCNVSLTKKKGTLRGLHYQKSPSEETKILRCTRGKLFSVIIDLRPNSSTFKKWHGKILSQDDYTLRYIPKGFANGIQSLKDDTEIFYLVSEFYNPSAEGGIHWNDPDFNIKWPLPVSNISEKDDSWPFFSQN